MGAHLPSRVWRKASERQQDRLPVSSYEEAVRFLVTVRADATKSDEVYDALVEFAADIFWVTDKRVRRDVRVACNELGVQ